MFDHVTPRRYLRILRDCEVVENPTDSQLRSVFPHLDPHQMDQLEREGGIFALPGVASACSGSIKAAQYFPAFTNEQTPFLSVCSVDGREDEHYSPILFWKEAEAFAMENWADDLVMGD